MDIDILAMVVILCVVLDHDGYNPVLQVMTKDLLSLVSKP
jgi:hypothetical protein